MTNSRADLELSQHVQVHGQNVIPQPRRCCYQRGCPCSSSSSAAAQQRCPRCGDAAGPGAAGAASTAELLQAALRCCKAKLVWAWLGRHCCCCCRHLLAAAGRRCSSLARRRRLQCRGGTNGPGGCPARTGWRNAEACGCGCCPLHFLLIQPACWRCCWRALRLAACCRGILLLLMAASACTGALGSGLDRCRGWGWQVFCK